MPKNIVIRSRVGQQQHRTRGLGVAGRVFGLGAPDVLTAYDVDHAQITSGADTPSDVPTPATSPGFPTTPVDTAPETPAQKFGLNVPGAPPAPSVPNYPPIGDPIYPALGPASQQPLPPQTPTVPQPEPPGTFDAPATDGSGPLTLPPVGSSDATATPADAGFPLWAGLALLGAAFVLWKTDKSGL